MLPGRASPPLDAPQTPKASTTGEAFHCACSMSASQGPKPAREQPTLCQPFFIADRPQWYPCQNDRLPGPPSPWPGRNASLVAATPPSAPGRNCDEGHDRRWRSPTLACWRKKSSDSRPDHHRCHKADCSAYPDRSPGGVPPTAWLPRP